MLAHEPNGCIERTIVLEGPAFGIVTLARIHAEENGSLARIVAQFEREPARNDSCVWLREDTIASATTDDDFAPNERNF
ncbi:hypothetical protein WMF31_28175 [Sorangium sp. So ce1036]|uniref:hypothetical protein n=1 Tax=Sorangium sp. So ce1036 TaxID=3133328 RepID=UPI003F0F906B